MGVILTPSMDGKVKRRTDSTIFPETAESWRSILWGIIWPPKNTRVTWTGSMLKGNVIFQHQFLGDVLVFKGGVFDFDINYKGIFPSLRCSFKGMVLDMFFVWFLYYPFCTNIWGICSDFYPRRGFSGIGELVSLTLLEGMSIQTLPYLVAAFSFWKKGVTNFGCDQRSKQMIAW